MHGVYMIWLCMMLFQLMLSFVLLQKFRDDPQWGCAWRGVFGVCGAGRLEVFDCMVNSFIERFF